MYCKHCGKEIADDSKFCQYCGGKQGEITSNDETNTSSSANFVKEKKSSKSFFSDKIGWLIGYGVYVCINILLLIGGDSSPIANKYFWPFGDSHLMYHEPFNLTNYDITEFIVYVAIIPLIVIGWLRYKGKNK